ncbi:MAG: hypothetical protein ACM3NQ_09695 [Bacteroidales bacterium]
MSIALAVVLGVSLLAATQFTSIYVAPDAAGSSFAGKKVAALVITSDEALRMSAEEALVRALAPRQVQAVAAYRLIPKEELQNKDKVKPWFEKAGVQGVVVLRPVQLETKVTKYAPGWTTTSYNTFWGYYGYGTVAAYRPAHTERESIAVVETVVYDVTRDTLLWGAVSAVTESKGMDAYMKELVGDAVKEMKKAGLIKK